MRFRRLLPLALALPALLQVRGAQAAVSYEVFWVDSVDGARIRVEVQRNPAKDPQPVLLTYSPYTITAGATPAADAYASRYNNRGIARAVAHVIGTGGSTGCWDYGGAKEQQSGVDVVKALAALPWSNGKVGMIGTSYEGTTATMVAARGDDVPELKAIVPIAAISRWYDYAFHDGVRYALNSKVPTDEGLDTPLVFDAAYARTVSRDRTDPYLADEAAARAAECGALEHTYEAYRRDPDYGAFWRERDYRKDASRFRAATLLVHGWQDFNVKQAEAIDLWEALPTDDPETAEVEGVPLKRLYLTQESHNDGTGIRYLPLLDAFLLHFLKGQDTGIGSTPEVLTLGRDHNGAFATMTEETAWPPAGSGMVTLHLGRSFDEIDGVPSLGPVGTTGETGTLSLDPQNDGNGWLHVDPGAITEELTLNDPLNQDGHGYYSLFHQSEPLARDARIVGAAELDAWIATEAPSQHLTPLLVDVQPDGSLRVIERGFLNTDYRNGLARAEPSNGAMHVVVRFLPQDYTIRAGHRLGLILQGSNAVWAIPGTPGATSYSMVPGAATVLRVPITDAANAATLFG